MIFQNFQPGQNLRNYVKTYHLRHFKFPLLSKIPIKAFPPRAEQYIIFYVKGGETLQLDRDKTTLQRTVASITGQYTQMVNRLVTPEFLIIQVPFFPGALYQLTGIPFSEFRDGSVELESIYPKETREINQKLQEAGNYQDMIEHVDEFFTDLFNRKMQRIDRPFDKMLQLMCHEQSIYRIDRLADQACLSIRQFQRLSRDYFGVGPKTMARIARFNAANILRSKQPGYSWLDIAVTCGYEDYQHMVRDYRDFSGITPNKLWELEAHAPDRILGLR